MMRNISLFVSAAIAAVSMTQASAQPFNPIRALNSWYTDRNLVDIEVVGSTSLEPRLHRLEPERVLRFRLERAYVDKLIAEKGPGYEIVGFSWDTETGLPDSLFDAVANRGRFHEEIAGIPVLSVAEAIRRTLVISISSDSSAAALQHSSDFIRKCTGAPVGNGLWRYEWINRQGCTRPTYPGGSRYVAEYSDNLVLRIQCQEESFPGVGCHLRFPFEGFGVDLNFHRDHLANWREIVDRASAFLKSKQYR
jgi:hypothetical protein